MGNSRPAKTAKKGNNQASAGDPVLSPLKEAEKSYELIAQSWAEQIEAANDRAKQAEKTKKQLKDKIADLQEQVDLEREKASIQREKASRLATCLKDVHLSLFDGSVYSHILKACLTATGGTRGLYVTARGEIETLKVRAAVDVDGYPKSPPSDFVIALCRKALEEKDTVVCNESDISAVPGSKRPGEHFHNCAVAPVVLLKNLDGIVIVADKVQGDFDEEDVETLLSVGDQAAVAVENIRLHRELQSAYLATVSMLADAVEAKDPYTHGHCEMVSRYCRLTADRMSMDDRTRSIVCYAALLHDVGKIGVSDGVLNKPGPLLPEERELVRAHVRVGHDLINRVPALGAIADVVLHHHEWYDGTGYPDGLKGDEIPLAARIVSVVDAYCAMTTKRSYKPAYSDAEAREELARCAGTQFDPEVVKAFIEMLDSPHSGDPDSDSDAECGVLPGFGHIRDLQQATL